jgi:hypothetical protein
VWWALGACGRWSTGRQADTHGLASTATASFAFFIAT